MPKRTSIGLDIGSSAVRAAEVVIDGKHSELKRFAQVGLEPGAVVEGEVRDPAAVSAALKRLWSEGGFSRKEVVVGISSQRAMVRLLEMPKIDEKQLRSALRYEIGELLPIPLEQAVFDFTTLGPGHPSGDGGETTRVLVLVAQKDIVWDEITVAKRAGLAVRAVDASALALLRAVPPPSGGGEGLDAVVSLGAHLVVVAVRENGTPRFVRTATVATEATTEPAARAGSGSRLVPNQGRLPDGRPGNARPDPVVEEVRSSIEYFLSHAQGTRLEQVQLTGGGVLNGGLGERLASTLGIPVVPASFAVRCDHATLGFNELQFHDASQRWATAVGLALWGTDSAHAPSLLPPEIAQKDQQRRIIALGAAGLVVVAGGLGLLSLSKTHDTASVNKQVAAEQQQASDLTAQINSLNYVVQVQSKVVAQRELVVEALTNDINWVALNARIQKAVPGGTQITSIGYSSVPPTTAAAPGTPPGQVFVGTVTISAQTSAGLSSVAQFVDKMAKVKGLGAVWVSESGDTNVGKTSGMTFGATAEVTAEALSQRAAEVAGGSK